MRAGSQLMGCIAWRWMIGRKPSGRIWLCSYCPSMAADVVFHGVICL
jgi:hypothetical protein